MTAVGLNGQSWQSPTVEVPRSQWGAAGAGQMGPPGLPATPALGVTGTGGTLLPPNGKDLCVTGSDH